MFRAFELTRDKVVGVSVVCSCLLGGFGSQEIVCMTVDVLNVCKRGRERERERERESLRERV